VTFIDLEFGARFKGVIALSDVAASLVALDELLRDLGSIAAYSGGAAHRSVEVVAIEMRSPLKVRLSVFAISPEALHAFQQICRDVIVSRDADIIRTLELLNADGMLARMTEGEAERINGHIAVLKNAAVPLTRIEVRDS
jgi:hypothetical protein